MEGLPEEARKLRESGALGRSHLLIELFDFLVAHSQENRRIKEHEIAQQVFGRTSDFEPGQDALVRVQMHRLRSKLDAYYAGHSGKRLNIPKGDYRLVLEDQAAAEGDASDLPAVEPAKSRRGWQAAAIILALACIVLGTLLLRQLHAPADPNLASPLWRDMRPESRTTLIVVGDRLLYGERGTNGTTRFVEDPRISSLDALNEQRLRDPAVASRYAGVVAHRVPPGVAAALRFILPVLQNSGRRLRILPISQITADMIRTADVVYVGSISDLGLLTDPALAGSQLRKRPEFARALQLLQSGDPVGESSDVSYLSTFSGPSENSFMIIAGGSDAGIVQAAELATSPALVSKVHAAARRKRAFEALFEVSSLDNLNVGSRLVGAGPLDDANIWRGGGQPLR